MTRLIFMGTPDFAVPSLAALVGDHQVVAVVTQPDRPSGRGRQLALSPVKQFAQAQGIPVLQPRSLRSPEAQAELAAYAPDLIVVAAFGQILRPAVLALPPRGVLNVHASLLPRWRGAAPVQAAILAGDQVTGSTIMLLDEGMDTGPILAQDAFLIAPDDTGGSLTDRLSHHGAALLARTLPRWLAGEIKPQPQESRLATTCRPLRKEQGVLDWHLPAGAIARAVRAFNPWPAAQAAWQGQPFKILRADTVDAGADEPPGTVYEARGAILVAAGQGALRLSEVQMAGRRAMAIDDFVRGQPGFVGSRLT